MQTFGGCEGIHWNLICWSLRPPNTLLKTVLERARQGASTELVFGGNACHSLTHKFDELIKAIVCYWSSTLTVDRWPLTNKCPFTCLTMGGQWWTVDRWPLQLVIHPHMQNVIQNHSKKWPDSWDHVHQSGWLDAPDQGLSQAIWMIEIGVV